MREHAAKIKHLIQNFQPVIEEKDNFHTKPTPTITLCTVQG